MKYFVGLLLLCGAAIGYEYDDDLTTAAKAHTTSAMLTEWIDMPNTCAAKIKIQIQKEIDASYQYLMMAAHFSKDTVNRPGFAKTFFEAAAEERHHASGLIDYLSTRGELKDAVTGLITLPKGLKKSTWTDGVEALEYALRLETSVTRSIRSVIAACEKGKNDYHSVDFLTSTYLEEQYQGQRAIAEKLATLQKMMHSHGEIGEFLFDKSL